MNKEKKTLFFSRNTPGEVQEAVKEVFGAQIIQQHERYLGLPSLVGRGKRNAFNHIKEQVGRKIARWEGKLLSNASKEIIIKAVAQAIPTYMMSCFKHPESLCSELNTRMGRFWWGQKSNERRMAWMSWENYAYQKQRVDWVFEA